MTQFKSEDSGRDAYRDAGVDIAAGNLFVQRIKKAVSSTYRREVVGDLGGFGGLFMPDLSRYKNPILVSSTDGVGTKLCVAQMAKKHDTIGIDLVAMSVNDIVVQGAEPLFFLDYIGMGKLNVDDMVQVVEGIVKGCREAGCALIGGETAEMPSMYQGDDYDLAGFCVGIVDKDKLINGSTIVPGDVVLGLPSSGLHSNGYSLARKIFFERAGLSWSDTWKRGVTVAEELLKPTIIYVKPLLDAAQKVTIKGLVHITGGGFLENIPRVLPDDCSVEIRKDSYPVLDVFHFLRDKGQLNERELYRTFNMGIGMVVVVSKADAARTADVLKSHGMMSYEIGRVVAGNCDVKLI